MKKVNKQYLHVNYFYYLITTSYFPWKEFQREINVIIFLDCFKSLYKNAMNVLVYVLFMNYIQQ